MTKKAEYKNRLNKAMEELASLYPYGALLLATDPVAFLGKVIEEVKDSRNRKENDWCDEDESKGL